MGFLLSRPRRDLESRAGATNDPEVPYPSLDLADTGPAVPPPQRPPQRHILHMPETSSGPRAVTFAGRYAVRPSFHGPPAHLPACWGVPLRWTAVST